MMSMHRHSKNFVCAECGQVVAFDALRQHDYASHPQQPPSNRSVRMQDEDRDVQLKCCATRLNNTSALPLLRQGK